ncbi:hypothetical protein F511_30297 [Dorcoceras hygrometricum]|uniref:Uncharacterized protein n=1 Tax=Dorcoceras hygrometricum TaxID=472368 RepID=A0A2Z7BI61_9LAMI|nr:hypothetical protein F511_30297 [Dorcoceras hygrometricum]
MTSAISAVGSRRSAKQKMQPAVASIHQLTRSARAGSAMMTSAVMSSQSAVSYNSADGFCDDDNQQVATVVCTSRRELQYNQSLGNPVASYSVYSRKLQYCGSLRQSGPRPDPRLLRQAALEALTRSARTNTPRKTRPEQFPAKWRRRRRGVRLEEERGGGQVRLGWTWAGPTGPGPNDDIYRCDFIVTPIADQIGPIDSVSKTECYDMKNNFSSGQLDVENPFVLISSGLLVQPDEGVSDLVVDRIGDNLPESTEKSRIIVITVGARHKCQRGFSSGVFRIILFHTRSVSGALFLMSGTLDQGRIVAKGSGEPDHVVEVVSGASRRRAGASTCRGLFYLVGPRFEVRSVTLEPSGPGGGPAGRAPTVMVGAGRTNAKTSRWLRGHSMAGASTCSDQLSLVSQRFEPRSVRLGPSGPGGGPTGRAPAMVAGSGRTNVKTVRCSRVPLACACVCPVGLVLNGFCSIEQAG